MELPKGFSRHVSSVSYTHLDVYKRQVLECDGEVIAVVPFEVSQHARYQSLSDSIGIGFEPSGAAFGAILRNLTSNVRGNR